MAECQRGKGDQITAFRNHGGGSGSGARISFWGKEFGKMEGRNLGRIEDAGIAAHEKEEITLDEGRLDGNQG